MSEDIDRPPAGTECCVCRTSGHYCPASRYVGKTDTGICEPCVLGKDCPTHAAIRKATAAAEREFEGLLDPPQHALARTVPREEWRPDEITKASTTEIQDLLQTDRSGRSATRQYINEVRGTTMTKYAGKTEQREKAKKMLLAGGSLRDVAEACGLSQMTVQKCRKELGMVGKRMVTRSENGKEQFAPLHDRSTWRFT